VCGSVCVWECVCVCVRGSVRVWECVCVCVYWNFVPTTGFLDFLLPLTGSEINFTINRL
jgi:hypothetical protein